MARTETFIFPSSNGKINIHARKWLPENGEYKAILQITHGMQEYIERYDDFARFMADNGFLVIGHDHVGHGRSVRCKAEYGYFGKNPSEILVRDMHTLRCMFQEYNKPYFMLGHSMGSYLLREYLTIYGKELNGALILGTGYIPQATINFGIAVAHLEAQVRGWHHRSKLLQQMSFSKPYRNFCLDGSNPHNSWLTKDVAIVKNYYKNPKCTFLFTDNGYLGLFEAISFCEKSRNVKRIPKELPMVLLSGADDPVGDFGEGVITSYEQYANAGIYDIILKLYPNDRHEILNETNKDVVFKDILEWIKQRM